MKEPDIWLQPDEDNGHADCGCELKRAHQRGDDPAFTFCPMHEAAGELLKAAKRVLEGLDSYLAVDGMGTDGVFWNEEADALRGWITKAEGGSK